MGQERPGLNERIIERASRTMLAQRMAALNKTSPFKMAAYETLALVATLILAWQVSLLFLLGTYAVYVFSQAKERVGTPASEPITT